MKIYKKLFFFTSLAFFLFPLISSASTIAPRPPKVKVPAGKFFSDVPQNHPFSSSIEALKAKALVKGYANGKFQPDNSISRAEFITMVMASVVQNPAGKDCFNDVKNEWFARFVCTAKDKGLVSGYEDGTFKPHNNISFAEASVVLANAFKLRPAAAGGIWHKPFIESLEARSAIPTSIDYVEKKVSRGEVTEMIWRLKNRVSTKPTKRYVALTADLPKLESCQELEEKLKNYAYIQSKSSVFLDQDGVFLEKSAVTQPMALESASPAVQGGAVDYSSTNVQVEGVDEADIVKNDGEFIYLVSGANVRIIKAFPPEQMKELSKLTMNDKHFRPIEIYLSKNKLVVIGNTSIRANEESPRAYINYVSRTKVYVFDTSDKQNIREERSVEFDGSQLSSRRIGNHVYLVLNDAPDYYHILEDKSVKEELPSYRDSREGREKPVARCSDIRFIPQYDQPNFLIVASIDIENSSAPITKEVTMGAGNGLGRAVYASAESLYIAAQRWPYPEVGIFDIWMPPPPSGTEKTAIFRFSLDKGAVKYKGNGEVKGHLLNQFSMDESGSAFRVATTTGEVWNTRYPSKNHLFILDRDNLDTVIGKIEDIAPGERIYSVRFIGKRAYMVTFKKIDPFFVIDVENPANPKILGALKIPGYSDYLHPFDENHIIGFGKETADPQEIERSGLGGRGFDFAWYQGMKIALFDVKDVTNPKVLFKEVIGDRGTESEVLRNHKALLYDKTRGFFAFPVTVAEIKNKSGYTGSAYGEPVFQGAYIYTLDLKNGFQLKGKITHFNDPEIFKPEIFDKSRYWRDQTKNDIHRIIYLGDFLYTLSFGKVKAVKREDMKEVKTIELQSVRDIEPPMILE